MKGLTDYLDAVSDALSEAGIGVRGDGADVSKRLLSIDMEALPDGRTAVMVWTPDMGWRVATAKGGELQIRTIRYMHAGPAPSPRYVAATVGRWLANASALTDVAPDYGLSAGELEQALTEAVVQGNVAEDEHGDPGGSQSAVASLHRAETVMTGGPDPDEPNFYGICVHCTELMNTGRPPGGPQYEQEWPCPTAVAAGLDRAPVVLNGDGPTSDGSPF